MKKPIAFISFAALLFAAGCNVGPDFLRPKAPDVSGYTTDKTLKPTASAKAAYGGAAQKFDQGGDIPSDWWKLFESKPLDSLVRQALVANPDLQAAEAALRQANENTEAEQGYLFPTVNANAGATREKISGAQFGQPNAPGSIFSLYNASVSVSYGIDFFGLTRRAIENQSALAAQQEYLYQAAYISLTANVVTAAIKEAALREQIRATKEVITVEREQLKLLKGQLKLGGIAKPAVVAQEANLSQEEATLPPLEKQLALTRDQLAELGGKFPAEGVAESFTLDSLHLPREIPVTLPSKLVEQRPDIRAAEEQLHAASAEIGVAQANMLPQVTLTGSFGRDSLRPGQLFNDPAAEVWNVGAGVTQPLFHGFTLLHQKRAAQAAFERASAQYRSTVLQAFQNVADSLRTLQYDANALAAQVSAEKAARASLDLARDQYKAGSVSYLSTLDAELTWNQARIGLVQAEGARYSDTAALFQSLGGGWWNRADGHRPHEDQKSHRAQMRAEKAPEEEKHG